MGKRDSDKIDELKDKADKLIESGMSIIKACEQVGLQPTVYHFRKRRDAKRGKEHVPVPDDAKKLMNEIDEMEKNLVALKVKFADLMRSK